MMHPVRVPTQRAPFPHSSCDTLCCLKVLPGSIGLARMRRVLAKHMSIDILNENTSANQSESTVARRSSYKGRTDLDQSPNVPVRSIVVAHTPSLQPLFPLQ
jgi:hypothetical protein